MKTNRHVLFTAIVLSLAAGCLAPTAAAAAELPEAIERYYRYHNFLSAFSTAAERKKAQQAAFPDNGGGTHLRDGGERLHRIREAVDFMRDRQWRLNPPLQTPPASPFLAADMPFLEIVSAAVSDTTVAVRVRALFLPPGTIRSMIQGDPAGRETSAMAPDPDRSGVAPAGSADTALHFWFNVDGQWRILGARIGLIR